MLDFIKSLFGKGKLRYQVEFDDGVKAIVKVSYIGDINTRTSQDEYEIRRRIEFELNRKIRSIEYMDYLPM